MTDDSNTPTGSAGTSGAAGNLAPPPPAPAPPEQPTPRWRLLRSADGMIGGVAEGFAAATGFETTLVRLAFVAAGLSGFGIIAYLVLWLVVPRQDPAAGDVLVEAPEDTRGWMRLAVIGGGVVGLLGVLFNGPLLFDRSGFTLGLLLIIAGALLFFWRRRDREPGSPAARGVSSTSPQWAPPAGAAGTPNAPTPQRATADTPPAPVSGAPLAGTAQAGLPPLPAATSNPTPASAIVARVCGWLVALVAIPITVAIVAAHNVGAISVSLPGLMLALGTAAIVHLIVWSSLARRAGPVIGAIAALLAVGGVVAAVSTWQGEVGEEIAVPASLDMVDSPYEMAAGHQVIDLSQLASDGVRVVEVEVDHGIGYTEIVVPDDVTVAVDADIQAGSIEVFGEQRDGWNTSLSMTTPPTAAADPAAGADAATDGGRVDDGSPVYQLDLEMGFGKLEVCRAADARTVDGHLECGR